MGGQEERSWLRMGGGEGCLEGDPPTYLGPEEAASALAPGGLPAEGMRPFHEAATEDLAPAPAPLTVFSKVTERETAPISCCLLASRGPAAVLARTGAEENVAARVSGLGAPFKAIE